MKRQRVDSKLSPEYPTYQQHKKTVQSLAGACAVSLAMTACNPPAPTPGVPPLPEKTPIKKTQKKKILEESITLGGVIAAPSEPEEEFPKLRGKPAPPKLPQEEFPRLLGDIAIPEQPPKGPEA